ncbi:hypothetical protein A9Q99_05010 [Gammaproteobacteria bacterium 45_16_T64]|mgnify:CR=1 FL=1|nr:hypothetical protein A9Q99_05010 [Gammaproteobacteria bacterium 45_16_T64]
MAKFDEYQAFITIVELNSLSKAAKALHLSPSAISKKLTLLEDSLGVQLVDRTTRSLAVTDLGKSFYKDCKAILSSVLDAEERILDTKEEPIGKLKLSCPRVLLQPGFFNLINRFAEEHPTIKIDFSVSDSIEDLVDGQIDFSFRIGPLRDSRLTATTLMETRPVFCASPEYFERYGPITQIPTSIEELAHHKIIIPTYINLADRIRSMFPGYGMLDIDLFHTTNDVYAQYQLVRQGGGITMMLDLMVKEDIRAGKLQAIFPAVQFPPQQIVLLHHKKQHQPRKMVLFKEFIKAKFVEVMSPEN